MNVEPPELDKVDGYCQCVHCVQSLRELRCVHVPKRLKRAQQTEVRAPLDRRADVRVRTCPRSRIELYLVRLISCVAHFRH